MEIKHSHKAGADKELWWEFMIKDRQNTPARIENAAKAIGGIISITFTLLVSLLPGKEYVSKLNHFAYVVFLWLASVFLAFLVIFPFPYRYSQMSVKSFQKSHRRSVWIKYILLIISVLLYLTGMFLLAWDIMKM